MVMKIDYTVTKTNDYHVYVDVDNNISNKQLEILSDYIEQLCGSCNDSEDVFYDNLKLQPDVKYITNPIEDYSTQDWEVTNVNFT